MADPTFIKNAVLYQNPENRVTVFSGSYKGLPAAIKERIHESLPEANSALREVLSQIQLDHESICKVYDCFLEPLETGDIRSVIVVELMDQDLFELIKQRGMQAAYWSEAELLDILRNLTEVLVYAQSRHVSHRDIKPQNIFVKGQVMKLGDFGSSSSNNQGAMAYSIQGSPFFLSPELKLMYLQVLNGEEAKQPYDPFKSDVYSLGVTMLFMALLRTPSEMANLATLRESTELLLTQCPGYPILADILRRMLAIKPEDRIDFSKLYSLLSSDSPEPKLQPLADLLTCEHCKRFQLPPDSQLPPVTTEFCTCILCPSCGKVLLRDSAGDIQGCNCALKCVICERLVESEEWIEHLPASIKEIGLVCSQACLEKFARENDIKFCVWCEQPLEVGEFEPPKLDCNHYFHNYSCFYNFLLSAAQSDDDQVSVLCPACQSPISYELIRKYFGKQNLRVLKTVPSHSICACCLEGAGLVPKWGEPPRSAQFICVDCFLTPTSTSSCFLL